MYNQWYNNDEVVTTTTTTEYSYDDEGRVTKETVTETKVVRKSQPSQVQINNPYPYPYTITYS